jgi:hypothetical protein
LVPTSDGGDDLIEIDGPDERLGVIVGLLNLFFVFGPNFSGDCCEPLDIEKQAFHDRDHGSWICLF